MKKLIYLFLALLIFACSSDDGNNDDGNQLFLEKYDGVVWESEGQEIAFQYTNIPNIFYNDSSQGCVIIPLEGTYFRPSGERLIFLIEEETENSLTRKRTFNFNADGSSESNLEVYTISSDGNTLTVAFSYGDTYVSTRTDNEVCTE